MTDLVRMSQDGAAPGHPPHAVRDTRPFLRRASFGALDDLIARVADTEVTVLIRGERGTGKELAARAIHASSTRRDRPFVKINCAAPALPLEAELFGWELGAVAGAGPGRPGRLEFAHHGTLFLDHVSALPLELQRRLDRALREGGVARLGAREPAPVDVRLIASTEHDLERAVAEGRFREELFFRLNVVCLTLPPLRQRRHEIRELTDFFVRHYASHYNKPETFLSADTLRVFSEYGWPGNVHELDSVVKRIVMLGAEQDVRQALMRPAPEAPGPPRAEASAPAAPAPGVPVDPPGLVPLKQIARQAAEGAERALIFRTLQHTRWNRREAAEMLRVSYKALLYKIKRAELDGAS